MGPNETNTHGVDSVSNPAPEEAFCSRMAVLIRFTCDVAMAARYPVQAVCDRCHR